MSVSSINPRASIASASATRAGGFRVECRGFGLDRFEFRCELPPIGPAHSKPQLLQPIGRFFVFAGLARLLPDGNQSAFDFIDDVRESQQILIDPFQSPQGFDLLRFEAADAGRFLEDHAPLARRSLQQDVDLALLDDSVSLGRGAGAGEKLADVAQPAGLPIEQILSFAAPVDSAGNLDLGRVRSKSLVGIVENQARFGRV